MSSSSAKGAKQRAWGKWEYKHTVLSLTTLAYLATMAARLSISPMVPDIADTLQISYGQVGLALTGMWLMYALSQFPSGILGDKIGERKVIVGAMAVTTVASLLLAVSPSFVLFLVFVTVLGAGAGFHYSVATTFLSKEFDDIGWAMGVHSAGGPLAGLIIPPLAVFVGARYGWRAAIVLGAVASFPILVAIMWWVRDTEPAHADTPFRELVDTEKILELVTRPTIAYPTILSILGAFAWQATASFLPAFLVGYHGLSQTTAGLLFSAYFVLQAVSHPGVGALSDRFTPNAAVTVTMAAGVLGYGLLIFGSGLAAILVAILLIGPAMAWEGPLNPMFMNNLSEEERGTGYGLFRTIYLALGASGSVAVGSVSDAAGWFVAFGVLSADMLLALAIVVFWTLVVQPRLGDDVLPRGETASD